MYSIQKINQIAEKIKKITDPKAIYLFGSYANGQPGENSDVDIAVIKDKIKDKHKELYEIRKALFSDWIPLEIILLEEKSYEEKKNIWGTIQYEIYKKGVKLYEK